MRRITYSNRGCLELCRLDGVFNDLETLYAKRNTTQSPVFGDVERVDAQELAHHLAPRVGGEAPASSVMENLLND